MKIKLSHYWWYNLYFILGLGVIFEIILSYLLIGSTSEEFKMLVGVMLFYCVCFLDVAFRSWRFLMTMEIKEGAISSFLFGKLKCEVFVDREIFYAIFDCRESLWRTNKYIAISNEIFTCETRKATF